MLRLTHKLIAALMGPLSVEGLFAKYARLVVRLNYFWIINWFSISAYYIKYGKMCKWYICYICYSVLLLTPLYLYSEHSALHSGKRHQGETHNFQYWLQGAQRASPRLGQRSQRRPSTTHQWFYTADYWQFRPTYHIYGSTSWSDHQKIRRTA